MGNIQTIWSAVADEVNCMVETHKVAVGESVSTIEELRHQMMSVCADLKVADQWMNCHRANLDWNIAYIRWVKNHSGFTASQVTVLEGDWGTRRFSKHLTLLECMDKQDTMIQDLKEQVVILQGNCCKCFNARSGSSADADGELDYEEDKGVEV